MSEASFPDNMNGLQEATGVSLTDLPQNVGRVLRSLEFDAERMQNVHQRLDSDRLKPSRRVDIVWLHAGNAGQLRKGPAKLPPAGIG